MNFRLILADEIRFDLFDCATLKVILFETVAYGTRYQNLISDTIEVGFHRCMIQSFLSGYHRFVRNKYVAQKITAISINFYDTMRESLPDKVLVVN